MAVDLDTAKQHLNITFDTDDALVERLIATASEWLDSRLGYSIATKYPDGAPAPLDHAVLLLVGHWYANREATLVGVNAAPLPFGLVDIVNDYRNWSWGEADDE